MMNFAALILACVLGSLTAWTSGDVVSSGSVFCEASPGKWISYEVIHDGKSLSFAEGKALSAEKNGVLLVFVHGSDWHPFGERLFEDVWNDAGFAKSLGNHIVLADVDILQTEDEDRRKTNDERNASWVKKDSGLRTYPAVLAYASDGKSFGALQGLELPKNLEDARSAILEFSADCIKWNELGENLIVAQEAGDSALELKLLVARDHLRFNRSPNFLANLQRLDPEDSAGHHARLSFPNWNAFVKQATDESKAGKGAEVEKRLLAMLSNPAFTVEQRAIIQLALGSAYRRWEGHEEQAAISFKAAWEFAPESICGRAGLRLHLQLYGGPSLAFGWANRHFVEGESNWNPEDFPKELAPGTYRLRLKRTHGEDLVIRGMQVLSKGAIELLNSHVSTLNKSKPTHEVEFLVTEKLSDVTLNLMVDCIASTRGTIEWTRLTPE